MTRARTCAVLLGVVMLLGIAAPAWGHGGLEESDPGDGARLGKPPRRVLMTFSEVPAADSVMKVVDGCKRDVAASTSVVGSDLIARIADGEPGSWKASYRVISAEDGHLTRGTIRFTVRGEKDCNPDDGGDKETSGPNGDGSGNAGSPPGDDDGNGFPVVPVAVGTAGLVLVGLVVRRVSAG